MKTNNRMQFNSVQRQYILGKSDCRCAHCGIGLNTKTMTVDHIVPISNGGDNEEYNLLALCEECNKAKSDLIYNPGEYYRFIKPEYINAFNDYYKRLKSNVSSDYLMKESFKQLYNPTELSVNLFLSSFKHTHNTSKSCEIAKQASQKLKVYRAVMTDIERIEMFMAKNGLIYLNNVGADSITSTILRTEINYSEPYVAVDN